MSFLVVLLEKLKTLVYLVVQSFARAIHFPKRTPVTRGLLKSFVGEVASANGFWALLH